MGQRATAVELLGVEEGDGAGGALEAWPVRSYSFTKSWSDNVPPACRYWSHKAWRPEPRAAGAVLVAGDDGDDMGGLPDAEFPVPCVVAVDEELPVP